MGKIPPPGTWNAYVQIDAEHFQVTAACKVWSKSVPFQLQGALLETFEASFEFGALIF